MPATETDDLAEATFNRNEDVVVVDDELEAIMLYPLLVPEIEIRCCCFFFDDDKAEKAHAEDASVQALNHAETDVMRRIFVKSFV
jgi:hypothetical protein